MSRNYWLGFMILAFVFLWGFALGTSLAQQRCVMAQKDLGNPIVCYYESDRKINAPCYYELDRKHSGSGCK